LIANILDYVDNLDISDFTNDPDNQEKIKRTYFKTLHNKIKRNRTLVLEFQTSQKKTIADSFGEIIMLVNEISTK